MATELSLEEKVDYIYKELKWQKRSRFLNFAFKISIIAILIFGALNISKWFTNDIVIEKISSTLWTIVKPIVYNLVKDMQSNNEIDKNIENKNGVKKIIKNPN